MSNIFLHWKSFSVLILGTCCFCWLSSNGLVSLLLFLGFVLFCFSVHCFVSFHRALLGDSLRCTWKGFFMLEVSFLFYRGWGSTTILGPFQPSHCFKLSCELSSLNQPYLQGPARTSLCPRLLGTLAVLTCTFSFSARSVELVLVGKLPFHSSFSEVHHTGS